MALHPTAGIVSVLLESDSGVAEFFIKATKSRGRFVLQILGAKAISGKLTPASPDAVISALTLQKWCERNAGVFEGYVVG